MEQGFSCPTFTPQEEYLQSKQYVENMRAITYNFDPILSQI